MTQTALGILGIDALDGNIKPKFSARANPESQNPDPIDVSTPHPDMRRGGTDGNPVSITEDTAADHDGYMGRGSGKKTIDGNWDPNR